MTPVRKGNVLKRMLIVVAAVCIALTAGCAKSGGDQAEPASSDSAIETPVEDALPRAASIPTLELVSASGVADGDSIKTGATLASGSYKPGVTGSDLVAIQWVIGEDDGLYRLMLNLQFGEEGTKRLAALTRSVDDQRVLVVLDGLVVGDMAVYKPIDTGAVTLSSPDVLAAKAQIDAAAAPLQ